MAERFDSPLAYREDQLQDLLYCVSTCCWRCRAPGEDLCHACHVDRQAPDPAGWTAPQVAELADVPVRTVQWWRKNGVLGPTFLYGPTGHVYYSFADICAHRVFADLVKDNQVSRHIAQAVAGDVSQYTAGGSIPTLADRDFFTDESRAQYEAEGDVDIWERGCWLIVPLVDPGEDARYEDEASMLLHYGSTLPAPTALADRLRPGDHVVPIDAARAAYPIARTVQLVADRVDAFVRARHKLRELPWWMVR
jgi:hypothetical protein